MKSRYHVADVPAKCSKCFEADRDSSKDADEDFYQAQLYVMGLTWSGWSDMHDAACRAATLDALSVLAVGQDSGVAGGEGAIYFWAKLPQGESHEEICHHCRQC